MYIIYMFVTFSGFVFKRLYDADEIQSYKKDLQNDGVIENVDYYVRIKSVYV